MSNIKRIGLICAAVGAVCALIGMAVFKGKEPQSETKTFESADVILIESAGEIEFTVGVDVIAVEFIHSFDGSYEAELIEGTLSVSCRPALPWYRSLFKFAFGDGSKLHITLPDGYEGKIFVKDGSGATAEYKPEKGAQ